MKGCYVVKLESLYMVNTVITELCSRKAELQRLYRTMLETELHYPLEEKRIIDRIETIDKAITSVYEAELHFPDRETPVREEEIPIRVF